MTVNTAPIKWAQRSDSLYVTIALQGKVLDGRFAAAAAFSAALISLSLRPAHFGHATST